MMKMLTRLILFLLLTMLLSACGEDDETSQRITIPASGEVVWGLDMTSFHAPNGLARDETVDMRLISSGVYLRETNLVTAVYAFGPQTTFLTAEQPVQVGFPFDRQRVRTSVYDIRGFVAVSLNGPWDPVDCEVDVDRDWLNCTVTILRYLAAGEPVLSAGETGTDNLSADGE